MGESPTTQETGRRRVASVVAAVLLLLAATAVGLLVRRAASPPQAREAEPPRAAPHAEPRVPAKPVDPSRAVPAQEDKVMPVLGGTPAGFQESVSAAHEEIFRRQPGLSSPAMVAMAIREGITRSGGDPDRTLAYWLSPAFERDLAASPPGEAVDARRTVESLVAQLLGDGLGDAEFEELVSLHSAGVRDAARARRAAR